MLKREAIVPAAIDERLSVANAAKVVADWTRIYCLPDASNQFVDGHTAAKRFWRRCLCFPASSSASRHHKSTPPCYQKIVGLVCLGTTGNINSLPELLSDHLSIRCLIKWRSGDLARDPRIACLSHRLWDQATCEPAGHLHIDVNRAENLQLHDVCANH